MAAGVPAASLLPEVVRQRLVAFAAEALESLNGDRLPPGLRPVMSFAKQRRGRVAAAPILAALDDDDFRRRVAAQVRPDRTDLAAALDAGEPVAADPVDVAALAYLLRPPDWVTTLRTAVGAIDEGGSSGTDQAVSRMRHQVDRLRTELADVRAKHRDQTAALKADNAELRRSVAAERKQLKQAEQAVEAAARDQRRTVEAFERQSISVQSEQRRLRARVSELETQLLNHRQVDREQRGNETLRARLLLDTLVDAVQGLRQELALPPVVTLPADTVGHLSVDLDDAHAAGPRALGPEDPALLQQLISVPRAHLLVDGYNVTKLAWPAIPLDAQRSRLLRELAPIAARSGAEVTVVFDGAELEHQPRVTSPRGVRVRFSRPGITADEVLLDLLRVEPVGRPLVVVSSDGEVAAGATRAGARAVPSATLVQLMGRGSKPVGGGS